MAVGAGWGVVAAQAGGRTAAPSPAATQNTGKAGLTIHVEGISSRGGVLRLGLYDAATYPDDDSTPVATADVPATGSIVTVTLKGLQPGRYAIESFQDINGNGKMDKSWLGLPEEPYGFSRDAQPFLSKPSFNAVAFSIVPGQNSQTLRLQNSREAASAGF
jgi:uncharacterized protein (DUF2141 family)